MTPDSHKASEYVTVNLLLFPHALNIISCTLCLMFPLSPIAKIFDIDLGNSTQSFSAQLPEISHELLKLHLLSIAQHGFTLLEHFGV